MGCRSCPVTLPASSTASSNRSPLAGCTVSGGLACVSQGTPGVEHGCCMCGPGRSRVVLGTRPSTFSPVFQRGFVFIRYVSPWSLSYWKENHAFSVGRCLSIF